MVFSVLCKKVSRSFFFAATTSFIWSKASRLMYLRLKSSSSFWTVEIPIRWASGAQISLISRAMPRCRSAGYSEIYRILSSRSASWTIITRKSLTREKNILQTVSVCSLLLLYNFTSENFAAAFKISATVFPNCARSCSSGNVKLPSSL